ncbi:hypothetical protein D3C79_773410 [compost metagenome]
MLTTPAQRRGPGHLPRYPVGEGGDGHEPLAQAQRHHRLRWRDLQIGHLNVDHLHRGGGAIGLTVGGAGRGDERRPRADAFGQPIVIYGDHGAVAAAPGDVGVGRHILHHAVIPDGHDLKLLLEADGHPGTPRTDVQGREGMPVTGCTALLVVITTTPQRQRRQSYHHVLAQTHHDSHSFPDPAQNP